jgi:hypothetical protein
LLPDAGIAIGDNQGLPFQFNIAVTAPFREMLAGYQCVIDTYGLTRQAADELRGVQQNNPACRTTVEMGVPADPGGPGAPVSPTGDPVRDSATPPQDRPSRPPQ